MINYIPYEKIDRIKYDLCIEHSEQFRIYAYSWYLDAVCDRWDLLMEDEYAIVMPVPIKVKYGLHYVYMPPWVQQLGLFSTYGIDRKKVDEFVKKLSKRIRWIDYHLNANNVLNDRRAAPKKNYYLPLHQSFPSIQKNYNKNRKRACKNDFSGYRIDKKGDVHVFLSHYKDLNQSFDLEEEAISKLSRLYKNGQGKVRVWNLFKNDSFVAGLFWLKDKKRITYLLPCADEKAKKLAAMTFLINALIKDYESHDLVLDFEGSMIKGVETFYKSFGALLEEYTYYRKRIL